MRLKHLPALRPFAALAAATLALCSATAPAQTPLLATPLVRVTAPVTNTALVTLKGNTHPLAQARYDQGAASPSLATGRMKLLLKRSPAQQLALQQYLGGLQDPHSANYHKWLTPTAFGASFGIADADLQAVEGWLTSEGFKIEGVPASRNLIEFSGTTGQVAQAFHTSIHSYLINNETHHSNASDPEIPAALAPVVLGLAPLNDFRAHHEHVLGNRSQVTAKNGSVQVVSSLAPGSKPSITGTEQDGTTPFLYVTPSDAATIYDSPNVLNRNFKGTAQYTGSGVNIGVAEYSDIPTADYLNYRRLFLNESTPVQPNLVVDGVDPGILYSTGDAGEALLDVEVAAGLAPQANIYAYSSSSDLLEDGLTDAIIRAIEDNTVSLLSISYGECEAGQGVSGNAEISEIYQQAAAQGITVIVAAGDSGSASCDDGALVASHGLTVSGNASTPYNIAVGGTDFDVLSLNFTQYVGTGATGGSSPYYGSALGLIPENPWNDSITNNPPGLFSTNTAAMYDIDGSQSTILDAGSGGASNAAICPNNEVDQNGNCLVALTGYPTPPFQSAVSSAASANGATPAGVRYLPDVALFAAPGTEHQAAWAYCSDSTVDGASTSYINCAPAADGSFSLDAIGGTSASTPAFAGTLALVIQSQGGARQGVANNVLYNLQQGSSGSAVFRDITAGNNSVPCSAGSANCSTNDFLEGFNAGAGYDLASGLGSVDISALVSDWSSVAFGATTTALTVNGGTAPITITHGTAVTLGATVSPNTAAGTVSVTGLKNQGSAAAFEYIPIAVGTGTVSVSDLPGGSYNLQAYYPGAVNLSPSTSNSIAIIVNPEASAINFFLQNLDVNSNSTIQGSTIPFGAYGFAYVEPENANAATTSFHGYATGMVTLLNNGKVDGLPQTLNSQGVAAFPLYNFTPGTYSLGASFPGDVSYGASSTTTNTPLIVTKGNTTLSLTTTSTSIPASGSTTITVELSTDSASTIYPSGPITLSNGSTSFGGTIAQGTNQYGADALYEIFVISGASLASGSNTLTASYGGDGNYNGAANASIAITNSGGSATGPGFALAGPAAGINVSAPGASGMGTLTITPTNGFTGTVNLACQIQAGLATGVPSCTITPSVNITGGTAGTATITINTTAATSSLRAPDAGGNGHDGSPVRRLLVDGGGALLCGVLLFAVPARRRSWRFMLGILLAFGMLGAIGCGGSANSNSGGTSAGTYTATITGTSGTVSANTQVSVTVQ